MSAPNQKVMARVLIGFVFLSSLALFAVLLSGDLPAQQGQGKKRVVEEEDDVKQPKKKPPVVEEEEDTGAKQKKKVIRVDDDDAPRTKPTKSSGDGITGDLTSLNRSKHSGLKLLGSKIFYPHDVINAEYANDKKEKLAVEPLPNLYDRQPKLDRPVRVTALTQSWEKEKPFSVNGETIKRYTPYEELAQEEVAAFLKERPWETFPMGSTDFLAKREQFAYAAHILSEVEKWHRFARDKQIRQGEGWDKVQTDLKNKIVFYREQQLEQVLKENDWDAARDLARDIGQADSNQKTQERLAKRLAFYMVSVLSSGNNLTPEQLAELRDRLKQLEIQFPGSSAVEVIGKDLQKQAEQLFARAQAEIKAGRDTEGISMLKTALDLYPQLPELQTYYLQRTNAYPVLKVGVHTLPEFMAPGIACTESERQAVDMIFESLINQVPDGTGDDTAETYVPALAERMPQQTAQLVRRFRISRNAVWAKPNDPEPPPVTCNDVVGTYQFMTSPNSRFYNPAWKELVDNVQIFGDERQLNISLKHGIVDPYAAMTFKVLPDEAGFRDFKENFAKKPFGSGPYVLGEPRSIDNINWRVFTANRFYGARPGKLNMPRIREVHMAEVNPTNVVEEFRKGTFDVLLPDVIRSIPGGPDKLRSAGVKVVGPLHTRRIYFLAINLRLPVFESQEVRLALASAIERAAILKGVFGGIEGDRTLRGPFPTGSWACDPKDTKELDNPAFAKAIIKQGGAQQKLNAAPAFSIRFPQGDPQAEAAMQAIAKQWTATLGVKNINLVPTAPHDLQERVEKSHTYDLAYYYYDFPSEAYWLWPLLHFDGWYFRDGVTEDGQLTSLCLQAMAHRDPAELRKKTHDIDSRLREKMYFIPLWQLGSYVAIKDDIETPPLDPLRVLGEVGKWRRKPRQ
jgi:ABC-type transport system substrate-binding protein